MTGRTFFVVLLSALYVNWMKFIDKSERKESFTSSHTNMLYGMPGHSWIGVEQLVVKGKIASECFKVEFSLCRLR